MKILITGINGFVGSNLTSDWKDCHTLYGLDVTQEAKEGVERIYSWEELEAIPPVDAIIHLAGKAHDTRNAAEAQSYFEINTGLTQRIFDYFLLSTSKSFVFFSSVKASADRVTANILTEEVEPKPVGPYGESKILAEKYILDKFASFCLQQPVDKNVYILRPCMIHGKGNKGNLNLLYNVVKKGIPWPLGAYENKRSFCSVENISFVVRELIERGEVPSGIYHVCDDEALSTNELIGLICESMKRKPHIWKISPKLINAAASIGSTLHLPLNSERLQKLTETYMVSNKKIKRALNIKQMPISAKAGIRLTLDSFKHID